MERQYKDSGIEWIGRIPREWKTCKLNYVYKFQTGATPPTNNEKFFDGDYKWACIADLKSKTIYDTTKKLSLEGVERCSMNISPIGSLLYSFKLSVGNVAFCGDNMYTNEAIATFLEGKGYLPYLYYLAPFAIIQNANYNNIKNMQYLRIHLTKDLKGLYTVNYKTLVKLKNINKY